MASSSDDMADLVMPLLPLEARWPPFPLRQYRGFWLPEKIFPGLAAIHACFEPRPSDIFLGSFPKSGTTWLKALAFATLNRADHPPCGSDHPLRHHSPHDCVKFFETEFALSMESGEELPSPRLLATHLPYSLLPRHITKDSGCRIVYVCRDPKDALISGWLFTKKCMASNDNLQPPSPFTIQEAFQQFCDGRSVGGPQWHHVVGYWKESQKRLNKVLFLRYEEMLQHPVSNVKKLAEFLGCEFSGEEEAEGVVQDIIELCSLNTLKNMEVNKSGIHKVRKELIKNEAFFRNGVAGDWSNHMTSAMAAQLDKIVEDALQGSGFSFTATDSDSSIV